MVGMRNCRAVLSWLQSIAQKLQNLFSLCCSFVSTFTHISTCIMDGNGISSCTLLPLIGIKWLRHISVCKNRMRTDTCFVLYFILLNSPHSHHTIQCYRCKHTHFGEKKTMTLMGKGVTWLMQQALVLRRTIRQNIKLIKCSLSCHATSYQ